MVGAAVRAACAEQGGLGIGREETLDGGRRHETLFPDGPSDAKFVPVTTQNGVRAGLPFGVFTKVGLGRTGLTA